MLRREHDKKSEMYFVSISDKRNEIRNRKPLNNTIEEIFFFSEKGKTWIYRMSGPNISSSNYQRIFAVEI